MNVNLNNIKVVLPVSTGYTVSSLKILINRIIFNLPTIEADTIVHFIFKQIVNNVEVILFDTRDATDRSTMRMVNLEQSIIPVPDGFTSEHSGMELQLSTTGVCLGNLYYSVLDVNSNIISEDIKITTLT